MQRSGRCPNTLSSNAADRAEEANDGNPYFLPVGFSIMGGWGTGARLLLHWLGEEADAAYGPCELGEDQWGCRKGAGYQAQAALRRAVASILAIWRAKIVSNV